MHTSSIIVLIVSICFLKITHSIDFQSNRQLGSMIFFLSGQNPNDFTNYGCWCSNKDKPIHAPLDEIDECCQNYQTCNTVQTSHVTSYPYKASYEDGTIECLNNKETKAHRQCECDIVLAKCLNKHQNIYTTNLLYISDNKCNPGIILNFDDLPTNTTSKNVPENYYNFTFTGGLYTTPKDTNNPPRPSGYTVAMVSPPNVLMSQNQMTIKRTDGQAFSIVSFSAAAAFVPNLKLNLIGSRQYSPILFNETVFLQIDTRKTIELNWSGIDMITFTGTGGSNSPSYSNTCGNCHFAMDDLRFRL
ncbi:unnamed protein product [Rotaria magnacalcarata]|uniref:Phospholipase A2-like central domain-containing protein n=6 Tax=Rotaria magnacalcarata TaxID=392030 RepID=A0A815M2H8_9BILA|nr:unnamed protein product [Rotaria magnacalcarata]CAF1955554.1 unnamed protein product [Rotaria magnacalcarata]CAF2140896.1 unnamed protein product [Rotaria magnacalcarata]CAF2156774.1 unnamed protein product [Rotaria magnacalcarata]CAF3922865.1 unnamed protein product [Rotaria magnacalcarata]